jgi:hypothetical protein
MTFEALGWQEFPPEPAVLNWIDHAAPSAQEASQDTARFDEWLRCGGTWFVGVDALPNDASGKVKNGPALKGAALDFAIKREGLLPLHRAQVSVIYPGYPKPMTGESEAAFRFRRYRDAAHVDGLLPIGPAKRRYLHEPHAFVLGIPLNASDAAPLVVWEGSHVIMQEAFAAALSGISPKEWGTEDLTEIYQSARKQCFERCRRSEIRVSLGGAYIVHRLALHGVAPWKDGETAQKKGRMIAYFRPQLPDIENWLR